MKKTIESRILLLISATSYFLSVGLSSLNQEIIASALNIIGIITLLLGIIRFIKEKKLEKHREIE